ncbi:MAG: HD-GYP domain-containing protein [Planctomycetes bacterium]|nr:HD-GYP domain-containing protein [Planctomycetota bacterium]
MTQKNNKRQTRIRLSDLIIYGKVPENEDKKMKMRNLDVLNNTIEPTQELYSHMHSFLEEVIGNLKMKRKFTIQNGMKIIETIVKTEKAIELLYGKAILEEKMENIVSHSVNVSIYAKILGQGLDYSQEQLTELGITALLHDIGMVLLPEEIINKSEKLTEREFETIKKHPFYTYKLLQTLEKEFLWISEIAYQEHEREGGDGYPKGLKGKEIHEYAKIIGIVDVYEALTHNRPQRRSYMPHEAVKIILSSQKNNFSDKIKRALLKKLSCFPVNSFIMLNSRAIGRVVEINENSPLRPAVEIVVDSQGNALSNKKVVHLEESPLLYIISAVRKSDLPE